MKSIFKNSRKAVAGMIIAGLMLTAVNGIAQLRPVIQDPKLGRIAITDVAGYEIDENFIQPAQEIKLRIPVASNNHGKQTPAGSAKIKIGLGSKLRLDPSFDLATAELSSYFRWTAEIAGGQTMIIGELVAPLPANFQEVNVAFRVKAAMQGKSTITANFLITNHNTVSALSDEDGANNVAFLKYNVSNVAAPVSITTLLDAKRTDCSISVLFGTNREINISSYEIEVSKDGVEYQKAATVPAGNLTSYSSSFPIAGSMQSKNLYIRVKTIYRTGDARYTDAKMVDANCDANWKADLYPNPTRTSFVTIRAVNGTFDGKYRIVLSDMSGKLVDNREVSLNNVSTFRYELTRGVAAGKYFIRISNNDGSHSTVLSLEKL